MTTTSLPDDLGHFGPFGGKFVPEVLMTPLARLEQAFAEAWADRSFRGVLDGLLRDYAGRPTPLYLAERLSRQCGGARIYLKREDLAHTGAHKINNALAQGLLCQRMGKARVVAETGPASTASPRPPSARCWGWTASSTWARRTCGGSR